MTKWRKKVRGSSFEVRVYNNLMFVQRFALEYFSRVNYLFEHGKIWFDIQLLWEDEGEVKTIWEDGSPLWFIKIWYIDKKDANKEDSPDFQLTIPINVDDRRAKDELVYLVQDFVMNCYFDNEYDSIKLQLKDMAILLGVDIRSIWAEVKNVERMILANFYRFFTGADQLYKRKELGEWNTRGFKKFAKYCLNQVIEQLDVND